MSKKKIIVGSALGLTVVVLGVMCICMAPKTTDKERENGLLIEHEEEAQATEGSGLVIETEDQKNEEENSSQEVADSEEPATGIINADMGHGETEQIMIYEMTPEEAAELEYEMSQETIYDSYEEMKFEPYTQLDVSDECDKIKQEIFGDSPVVVEPETVLPGSKEE